MSSAGGPSSASPPPPPAPTPAARARASSADVYELGFPADHVDRSSLEVAEQALTFLQAKHVEAMKMHNQTLVFAQEQMHHYLDRMQLDISPLRVVHIAGSKGKGSTSAFTETILRGYGLKTGLYTSPHLIALMERYRLNTEQVEQTLFLRHFWRVWDALWHTRDRAGTHPAMPAYFAFLTLVGFDLFVAQKVDVLVLEVGLGGKLDATNVVAPASVLVTAVTPLALEHTEILGNTLTLIAGEKAGIFKPGVPIWTVQQPEEAARALAVAAEKVAQPVHVAAALAHAQSDGSQVTLGLHGEHQYINAGLAVHLVQTAVQRLLSESSSASASAAPPSAGLEQLRGALDFDPARPLDPRALPPRFLAGLAATSWAGRCQTVEGGPESPNLSFHLDGAHTVESIELCLEWFRAVTAADPPQARLDSLALSAVSAVSALDTPAVPTAPIPALAPPTPAPLPSAPSTPAFAETAYVLLFNCGPVRNPFTLLQPLVTAALLSSSSATSSVSSASSLLLPQVLFSPFDHDKLSLNSPPSLSALAAAAHRPLSPAAAAAAAAAADSSLSSSSSSLAAPPPKLTWQNTLLGVWDSLVEEKFPDSHATVLSQLPSSISSSSSSPSSAPSPATAPPLSLLYRTSSSAGAPCAAPYLGQCARSAADAVAHIRAFARRNPTTRVRALVTGSLYLVGNVLNVLTKRR